jgi:hypothetical protein
LWRRPRPKLGCEAKERRRIKNRYCDFLKWYPNSCLDKVRKTTSNLSYDSRSIYENWSPGRDLNPGPPEYWDVITKCEYMHTLWYLVVLELLLGKYFNDVLLSNYGPMV